MWVHVQRVPKAKMQPPHAIAASVCITLLVLAIVLPVTSQGGAADLGTEPSTLRLDWFYLSGYALLYRWSPGAVWALAGFATISLAVLPWISPRLNRAQQQTFELTVHPGAHHLATRAGETLLDAGLRAGIALPFECRNGGCGVCVCSVVHGTIDHGPYQPSVLTQRMREEGKALLCCASARSDVEIEVESLAGADRAAVRTYTARVDTLERLSEDVILLKLSLARGERIEFNAGQYVNIVLEDGQRRAFSFANAPHDNELIELHVRLIPGGRFTTHVFTDLKVGDELQLEGPFGHFVLREGDKPILLVAGTTGFAPIKSIVEDAFHRGIKRQMHLYWGARRWVDLYMADLASKWQREHAEFSVTFVLSQETSPEWNARSGRLHDTILTDFPDLTGYEVYVCGSVRMVETAVPAFFAHGLSEEACISDAFQMSVRPTS
jgi:NAD(P)H-flavin reductase/ferredoxin